MANYLRPALALLLLMTILTGIAYPLAMTGIAQVIFPDAARGSLVTTDGAVVGSRLIGQDFTGPGYFHPRPSGAGAGYDAANSGGRNLGPTSAALLADITARTETIVGETGAILVPIDLVTASGSGLDPHISPEAAALQIDRVAVARGLDPALVASLVRDHTEGRTLGLLGEPRVNVLLLNLTLDALAPLPAGAPA